MFAITVIAVIATTIVLLHKSYTAKLSQKRVAERQKFASQFALTDDGLRLIDEWS